MLVDGRQNPCARYQRLIAAMLGIALSLCLACRAHADGCPTTASAIAADRPDVTNTPLVVPPGSVQLEGGVAGTWYVGSTVFDATESQLRFGVARCLEFSLLMPNYFYALDRDATSGFSDFAPSLKWQLPALYGVDWSATAGLAFPTDGSRYSGHGYDPFIQGSWTRDLAGGWGVAGQFSVFWHTSRSDQNPTFEPTFEIDRDILPTLGSYLEYYGDYPNHEQPAQVIDSGATWRIGRLQQADFHFGFGLNRASPDHFIGIGYSFRLDNVF